MIFLFLLCFLDSFCSNKLQIYDSQNSIYFFGNLTADQVKYLKNNFVIEKKEVYKIPAGNYTMHFNQDKQVFECTIESYCARYYKKQNKIVIRPDFITNIKSLLRNENFDNNGIGSKIIIDNENMQQCLNVDFVKCILQMCFDDSYVTINLSDDIFRFIQVNNITFTSHFINLDPGLMSHFNTVIQSNTFNDIVNNFKAIDGLQLKLYEKILIFFDPNYLSAKKILKEAAFKATILHSKMFRKRVAFFSVALFFSFWLSCFIKSYF